MSKKIVLWGATGQAKVLWELLEYDGHQVIVVFDNNPNIKTLSESKNISVLHGEADFFAWKKSHVLDEIYGMVAIGGSRGKDRISIQQFLRENGIKIFTAIHRYAFVAKDANLGSGCQILAKAAIASEAFLGEACIVNTSASVDHECVLGNGVHIGPGANLAGLAHVGDYSFIGTGAVVLPRIKIGRGVIVGAGAVVNKDIGDNLVVVGNTARVIKRNIEKE